MFQLFDEVKFSEQGLRVWVVKTDGKWADRCRKWRWLVLGFSEGLEGDCLRVIRLDKKVATTEIWHPSFFGLA